MLRVQESSPSVVSPFFRLEHPSSPPLVLSCPSLTMLAKVIRLAQLTPQVLALVEHSPLG